MIISISGLTGSGKNTVARLVADGLGLRVVEPTFKTIAAEKGMDLLKFQEKAEKEHSIDKEFDRALLKEASKGNCVVSTWLGPWIVKNSDLRVWLSAPLGERAKRVAKRDGLSNKDALLHVGLRDEGNRKRYLDVYGIDIFDQSGFGLVIDSGKMKPEDSAKMIIEAARGKNKKGKQ